jgi:hypothetical protein
MNLSIPVQYSPESVQRHINSNRQKLGPNAKEVSAENIDALGAKGSGDQADGMVASTALNNYFEGKTAVSSAIQQNNSEWNIKGAKKVMNSIVAERNKVVPDALVFNVSNQKFEDSKVGSKQLTLGGADKNLPINTPGDIVATSAQIKSLNSALDQDLKVKKQDDYADLRAQAMQEGRAINFNNNENPNMYADIKGYQQQLIKNKDSKALNIHERKDFEFRAKQLDTTLAKLKPGRNLYALSNGAMVKINGTNLVELVNSKNYATLNQADSNQSQKLAGYGKTHQAAYQEFNTALGKNSEKSNELTRYIAKDNETVLMYQDGDTTKYQIIQSELNDSGKRRTVMSNAMTASELADFNKAKIAARSFGTQTGKANINLTNRTTANSQVAQNAATDNESTAPRLSEIPTEPQTPVATPAINNQAAAPVSEPAVNNFREPIFELARPDLGTIAEPENFLFGFQSPMLLGNKGTLSIKDSQGKVVKTYDLSQPGQNNFQSMVDKNHPNYLFKGLNTDRYTFEFSKGALETDFNDRNNFNNQQAVTGTFDFVKPGETMISTKQAAQVHRSYTEASKYLDDEIGNLKQFDQNTNANNIRSRINQLIQMSNPTLGRVTADPVTKLLPSDNKHEAKLIVNLIDSQGKSRDYGAVYKETLDNRKVFISLTELTTDPNTGKPTLKRDSNGQVLKRFIMASQQGNFMQASDIQSQDYLTKK